MTNYAQTYDSYWRRPDRFGESSFDDPEPISRQIISLAGSGRVLDLGCGMGLLVCNLLAKGVDAYGMDVSEVAVAKANQFAPRHFFTGSLLALPFPDKSFDTLVSTDCLEHLAPDDVAIAFLEMYRVSRRNVFLRVATGPDRDGLWHLTIQGRVWWEDAAFRAGFRKHPAYYRINDFAALEHDGYTITIPLEKISEQALIKYPMEALRLYAVLCGT